MEGNWNGSSADAKNKYQYNGKELQTDFGLDWNDYGARNYDSERGQWTGIDQIAASTFVFNLEKNFGLLNLYSTSNPTKEIPQSAVQNMPDLDPTFVKAFAMQESSVGTDATTNGSRDIMQVNNGLSKFADWDDNNHLAKYGLSHYQVPGPKLSIFAGIRELGTKGFAGQKTNYSFVGWYQAVENYNGGGAASKGLKYSPLIKTMVDNAVAPAPGNY